MAGIASNEITTACGYLVILQHVAVRIYADECEYLNLYGESVRQVHCRVYSTYGSTFGGELASSAFSMGVGGTDSPSRLRFQNPAFGPFIIKANVHLESPRNESGRCTAAVSIVDSESMNVSLQSGHLVRRQLAVW